MKINNFLMILGLNGLMLSPISYVQGSTGRNTDFPVKEITIDPANAKSEVPYPPLKKTQKSMNDHKKNHERQ